MAGVIKSVLKEELRNSMRMKKLYEASLKKLPKGSFVKRKIGGHSYFYLVKRNKKGHQFVYKGRSVPPDILKKYEDAKKLRAKQRHLLSRVKRQIRYLKGVLRGKENI